MHVHQQREMEGGVEGRQRDGGEKGDGGCGEGIKWNVTVGGEDNQAAQTMQCTRKLKTTH